MHFLGATKVELMSMHLYLLGTNFPVVPNRMICSSQTGTILHAGSKTSEYCFGVAHA